MKKTAGRKKRISCNVSGRTLEEGERELLCSNLCNTIRSYRDKKGLLEHEIKEEDIYDYSYFLYTYLPIYFMYVKNKLFFTSENIIPSTVCDLNCRSCLNFNPYIKKHIVDSLEEVKADIDAFFGQVDLIYRLQISGGEPFLYKELGHVLEYIYENYKDKVIRLETVTNGTIVPSDELCRILKKCKVTVFLDDYRKTLPNGEALYERVKNKLNQEEISVIYNYAEKWIRMYSENSSHEEDSEEKLESFYERCGNPWSTLRKKKITGCNYAHYAAKAGILPDDEDNYFVLTGEVDKKALLEFRLRYNEKGYVEFCKNVQAGHPLIRIWKMQLFRKQRSNCNEMDKPGTSVRPCKINLWREN